MTCLRPLPYACAIVACVITWWDLPTTPSNAIDWLHLLGYLERLNWSHVIDIPDNGLIIRPDLGDVLRYCQRDRPSA